MYIEVLVKREHIGKNLLHHVDDVVEKGLLLVM